ncbi:MAG: dihydroorotase family protein [Desulfurococcaceae archaeon]
MTSIAIRNAKIPINDELVEGNILVEDGYISAIGKREYKGDTLLNAEGCLTVPGGIDIHAHIYDPLAISHEDWESGSLAGAYGGLTTIVDMPLRTDVDTIEALEAKIREAKEHSFVNYGITGGFLKNSNISSIRILRDKGVKTFKMFTCRPFHVEESSIGFILEEIARTNSIAIIHAEEDGLIEYMGSKYMVENSILAYHNSRSDSAEAAAILRVGLYARETNSTIHIAHLSSRLGLESISFLRRNGVKVTCEVCPHHLYFTREDSTRYGNYLKLAPTLKTKNDIESLWHGLANGLIDIYASDNAPSPRYMKETDTWSAWGGIPNLEIMGPFLYTYGVRSGILSISRFIKVFSENPARLLGLYPLFGSISIGSRADLYILDTRQPRKITASTHHHKVDWSPWEGIELYGAPLHLIVNGNVLIEKGEIVAKPGLGVYVGVYIR